ncbi:hypothetical protein POTOM_053023 [Populus tomentosa]|uniref:Uncharacterized protein n=1 Tax=Populus tomentosa TaxID=118781 RepID=A0A8X8C6F2_POPTO|nr:hypothetical protein POTOM_053023 [Populus tomentosa]
MPCLNISTNVNLDGVNTSAILSEASSQVAKIIKKPESFFPFASDSLKFFFFFILFCGSRYVMIVLKGSVPISFGGTEEPAAYGELVSIGGLSSDVNKKLSKPSPHLIVQKMIIVICIFLIIALFVYLRPFKPEIMHSVCVLYTNTRSSLPPWLEWFHLLKPASCLTCYQT